MKLPPTVEINKMSDKFRQMMDKGVEAPVKPVEAPTKPVEKPPVEKQETKPPAFTAPDKAAKLEKPDVKDGKIPRENFKVLETQRDEFKTRWEQAEAKALELDRKAKEIERRIPTDYEELKTRLAKHDEIQQRLYVEHSPQFKQAFDDKIAAGIEEAKEAVGADKAERVASLLEMPPSTKRDAEIDEITEGLSQFRAAALAKSFSEVRRLQKDRAAELAKSAENYKNLKDEEAKRLTGEKLSRQEFVESAFKTTLAEAEKKSVHFREIEGNAEHNARVAESRKMLKEFAAHDMNPADQARLAAWAVQGMRSAQTDAIKDALIQKLQAELREIQEAGPSLEGGGKGGRKAAPKTAVEKYNQAMTEGIPQE